MREQPFYRRQNDSWYVQFGKKQIRLAKGRENRAEAYRRFAELVAGDAARLEPDLVTVAHACDLFLVHADKHTAPDTFKFYRYFLQSFCDRHGTRKVSALKPIYVTQWMDAFKWNPTTRNRAVSCVKRAIRYGIDQGVLKDDPLKGMKKDRPLRRERLIDDADRTLIFDAVPERPFREYLFALQESGARPGEVRQVSREHVNLDAGVWVFRQHKTARSTGRPRVIYLTPAMVELTRALLARVPSGPLFLNARGEPWSRAAVVQRMDALRTKFPQLKGVVAYSFRHAFCTDGLTRGVAVATMAELLGHASTRMIDSNYGHLGERGDHLREAAAKATRRECT